VTAATALAPLEERLVGGHRLYAGGEGRPVVLLHGLGGAAANWSEVAPGLAAAHRVVAIDLPGHGGSEPPPPRAGMEWFADAVADVLDAERVREAIVVGHSFGGQVSLHLALRRPELVGAVLLVAPSGIRTGTRFVQVVISASTFVRPGRVVARARGRYAARAWFRRAVFRPWFVADADALSERAALGFLSGQEEHRNTAIAGRAMVADDPRVELSRLGCPALVLWGAADTQLPLDDAFEYARRLRAPLRVVADCGHLVIGERPAAVLDGVRHLDVLVRQVEALGEVVA
jgi:pimeloyl-ACP methyl ester carboxylesterase